jgi:hypothetical protein
MRPFAVVMYVYCAGKWTLFRARTALLYKLVLSGSGLMFIRILCRSAGSSSLLNKCGNVCCLVVLVRGMKASPRVSSDTTTLSSGALQHAVTD